jgi:hypothetical protein
MTVTIIFSFPRMLVNIKVFASRKYHNRVFKLFCCVDQTGSGDTCNLSWDCRHNNHFSV